MIKILKDILKYLWGVQIDNFKMIIRLLPVIIIITIFLLALFLTGSGGDNLPLECKHKEECKTYLNESAWPASCFSNKYTPCYNMCMAYINNANKNLSGCPQYSY
jgi:hypothetical protein